MDHKISEIYAGKKMYAIKLLEAAAGLKLGKCWPGESPHIQELAFVARKQESESDRSWARS